MEDRQALLALRDHAHERAGYYQAMFIRSHNDAFLDIEMTFRKLSSMALLAAQEEIPPTLEDLQAASSSIQLDLPDYPPATKPDRDCGCD